MYKNVFIYEIENMRNNKLKEVRTQWKESRFFYGKNRVMQLALGRTGAEEYKEGLHKIAEVCVYKCTYMYIVQLLKIPRRKSL